MCSLPKGSFYKVQWKALKGLGRLSIGQTCCGKGRPFGNLGKPFKTFGQVSETVFKQLPIYLHIYLFKYKSTIQWSY